MFYNYQNIMVCILFVPVVIYILVPLAMLVVWFFKQLAMGILGLFKHKGSINHSTEVPIPG